MYIKKRMRDEDEESLCGCVCVCGSVLLSEYFKNSSRFASLVISGFTLLRDVA